METKTDFTANQVQYFMKLLANATADFDGRGMGLYNFYHAVQMLKSKYGEEPLRKVWGNDANLKLKRLETCGKAIGMLYSYLLDLNDLENLRIKKEIEVTDKRLLQARKAFCFALERIDVLYEAFFILIDASPLKLMSIPHAYFGELPERTLLTQDELQKLEEY